jgi:hypothetical protein
MNGAGGYEKANPLWRFGSNGAGNEAVTGMRKEKVVSFFKKTWFYLNLAACVLTAAMVSLFFALRWARGAWGVNPGHLKVILLSALSAFGMSSAAIVLVLSAAGLCVGAFGKKYVFLAVHLIFLGLSAAALCYFSRPAF